MDYKILGLTSKNITVVFETLDLRKISIDQLKQVGGPAIPSPRVLEIDDNTLVAIFDATQTIAEIADRRLRVTDRSPTTTEGTSLPDLVIALVNLFPFEMIAYGFNFDVIVELEGTEDSNLFFRDRFLVKRLHSNLLAGLQTIGLETKLRLMSSVGTQYELKIVPGTGPDNRPTALCSLNEHYEEPELPNQDNLRQLLVDNYQTLLDMLQNL